jgi:O-antigen/teichoic acid export membrane protein
VIKKDFIKSSIIYTFSSALSTGASFLLLPFYTNTKLLTVSDFGALSLYIGLSLLVQVVASFSLDYYVGVAYHELKDRPEELKTKLASLNGYLLTIGAIIILLFAAGGNFFLKSYIESASPESYRYLMMSVFTGVFNAHFKFYNNLLVHREKPMRYFWSNILNFVTTVAFSIIILEMFPGTLEGPLWGRLLSCLSIFIVSFYEITFTYGIGFDKKFLKPAWQFCFPLMITAVFQWVLSYSDRYIIKPLLFNKEVAIFDLAVRCTLLVSFLLDGLSSAISPRIFSLLREPTDEKNLKEINKYYSGFNVVTMILIPLNIFILPVILPFFISSDKYLTAFLYFGIVGAGFLTRSIQNIFIFPIHVSRKTSRLIAINGISAVVQIGLGYLMVRNFKLYGAAFTLNIVKVLMLFLYVYFCKDLINPGINFKKMIWLPLAGLFIISIPELFISHYGAQMHVIHLLELIAIAVLTFIGYRNEMTGLLSWGKEQIKSRLS